MSNKHATHEPKGENQKEEQAEVEQLLEALEGGSTDLGDGPSDADGDDLSR